MNSLQKGVMAGTFTALAFVGGTQSLNNVPEVSTAARFIDPNTVTARQKWNACLALDNNVYYSNRPTGQNPDYLDYVIVLNGTLCMAPYL